MTDGKVTDNGGDVQKVSVILDAAADLVSRPGAWTQFGYAVDALGASISSIYEIPPDAECFCLMGAIAVSSGDPENSFDIARPVAQIVGCDALSLTCWNDRAGRTQLEVVDVLRRGASLSRTREVGQ